MDKPTWIWYNRDALEDRASRLFDRRTGGVHL